MTAKQVRLVAAAVILSSVSFGNVARAAEISEETVKAALPRLEAIVEDVLARTKVPGVAVGVVYGDKVLYLKGFGVRRADGKDAVDPDTIFQIASVSKPFASTAVAAVVGTGEVTWDSRVADLDPAFQMFDPWVTSQVTLRDMFCHRTGVPAQAGDLLEDLGFDRDEILHRFRHLRPVSSFRSQYAYTNFMLTEAAVAAAHAAGRTWEDLIAERVFAPLGMSRTSGREADFYAAENRATIHFIEDGVATARFERRPDAQSPAGGVSSTVRDMAKWLILQLNEGRYEGRQIVDAEALAETHRPQIVRGHDRQGRPMFYGLGWNVDYTADGELKLTHAGAFFVGARTQVALLPAHRIGVVVLANAFPTGAPEAIIASFLDVLLKGEPAEDYLTLYEQFFASLIPAVKYDTPSQSSSALPGAAYVGRYTNDYYGDAEIVADGAGLTLIIGPGKRPFRLRHYDRDAFLFDFVGLGDEGAHAAKVAFSSADGATADALTIDFLNATGQGTFTRSASD
ncbi:MAG TPA: serine hydrolase [Bauldia sp.]|nr:serine hydrolase [Bauldia sp.]